MTTSRKQINLGPEFAVIVNAAREQEFEVLNLYDAPFDYLKCSILNSTSWLPPEVYVTDEVNKIIKIKFTDNRLPANTSLLLSVQGCVKQKIEIVETKVLLDGAAVKAGIQDGASSVWLYCKSMFMLFLLASILLFFVKGTIFGDFVLDMWEHFNAAKFVKKAYELDPRVVSNKHQVYQTAHFTEANSIYKEQFGNDKELAELYRFAGNDFFVMQDLAKDSTGITLLVTYSDAVDFCDWRFGRLMDMAELKAYLAKEYLKVENPFWPINLRPYVAEWSGEDYSMLSDDYWLYLKKMDPLIVEGIDPGNIKFNKDKRFILADDGDAKAAFRCAFNGNIYSMAQ